MKKPDLSELTRNIGVVIRKHEPAILTGIGIAGMITTTILAVKATPRATHLIEERGRTEKKDRLTVVETIQAAWMCYIPTAVTGVLSIACLIGASSVNSRRNAALATAYSLSETALKDYREKVVETIGEKKEQVVRDAVAKEQIELHPLRDREVVLTGRGDTLSYDSVSGRYFKSDIEKLRRAENEINRRMISEMYVSLNEFYDEIGLEHIAVGDDLGWNVEKGFLELSFSAQLVEDGTPCMVINYCVAPEYNYNRF